MTPKQAVLHLVGVVIGVATFGILIATHAVTADVGVPAIAALIGSLTAPIVTQTGKMGNNATK